MGLSHRTQAIQQPVSSQQIPSAGTEPRYDVDQMCEGIHKIVDQISELGRFLCKGFHALSDHKESNCEDVDKSADIFRRISDHADKSADIFRSISDHIEKSVELFKSTCEDFYETAEDYKLAGDDLDRISNQYRTIREIIGQLGDEVDGQFGRTHEGIDEMTAWVEHLELSLIVHEVKLAIAKQRLKEDVAMVQHVGAWTLGGMQRDLMSLQKSQHLQWSVQFMKQLHRVGKPTGVNYATAIVGAYLVHGVLMAQLLFGTFQHLSPS